MNGRLFWALAAYSLAGAISGTALGSEWLSSDRVGIPYGVFNVAGWALLVAGSVIRLSMIRRRRLDKISRYFGLLSWSVISAAAVWSGVGFRGRWPDSDVVFAAHAGAVVLASLLGIMAVILTARLVVDSRLPVFRAPACVLVLAVASVGILWPLDILKTRGDWFAVAGVVSILAIAGAAMRISYLTPDKERAACQKQVAS